jgi:elongation factor 2
MQKVFISVPQDNMGDAVSLINQRRGTILDMGQEDVHATVSAKCPVSEMFGFASAIRGSTQGRALWSTENAGFEQIPNELQSKIVKDIRTRKGLNPEPYDERYYAGA